MNIKERISDWYLTKKTGKNKTQREAEEWFNQNVNIRANRINDRYRNFKHIFSVSPDKFFDHSEPFGWVPCTDARKYFWPHRQLGDNAVWGWHRVIKSPSTGNDWEINEIGGEDIVFVATNNGEDAVIMALKYS